MRTGRVIEQWRLRALRSSSSSPGAEGIRTSRVGHGYMRVRLTLPNPQLTSTEDGKSALKPGLLVKTPNTLVRVLDVLVTSKTPERHFSAVVFVTVVYEPLNSRRYCP